MLTQPGEAVLKRVAGQVIAPMGGRVNQHWLLDVRGERLVLRRWSQTADEIDYEVRLLMDVAALGWPVARVLDRWNDEHGQTWALLTHLPGEPAPLQYAPSEQRTRGRLLAEFHADLASLGPRGQRAGWCRCEELLDDQGLEALLAEYAHGHPEEARLLTWHLDRVRCRAAALRLHERPGQVVHGDFTPWNLLFTDGRLTGLLDFELAHWDHRIGDFPLAWRGQYDEVIHAYNEVSPLDADEWALLTPLWWGFLLAAAIRNIRAGTWDDGWTLKMLLRRSPLMGPDAVPFR